MLCGLRRAEMFWGSWGRDRGSSGYDYDLYSIDVPDKHAGVWVGARRGSINVVLRAGLVGSVVIRIDKITKNVTCIFCRSIPW